MRTQKASKVESVCLPLPLPLPVSLTLCGLEGIGELTRQVSGKVGCESLGKGTTDCLHGERIHPPLLCHVYIG